MTPKEREVLDSIPSSEILAILIERIEKTNCMESFSNAQTSFIVDSFLDEEMKRNIEVDEAR